MSKRVQVAFYMDDRVWESWERAAKTVKMKASELLRLVVVIYGCEWQSGNPDVIGALGLSDRECRIPAWALEKLASVAGRVGDEFREKYMLRKNGKT